MTRYFGKWGKVPLDGDVVPFSTIDPAKLGVGRTIRKPHYLSVTYMKGFVDERGPVQHYRLTSA